jgi:hypothetical protein
VAKDRARPFSRKHRRYWLTVTGGMILIAVVNIVIGYCTYPDAPAQSTERIELHVHQRPYEAPASLHPDADLGDAAPAGSARAPR